MRNAIALIAAIISSAGAIPYIIDTIKGKTHPNIVTWVTYALINGINAVVALNAGAPRTAVLSIFACAATATIAVMGIKHGVKKYTAFDIACQALAIAGIIIWQLTGTPALAVAIALSVMVVASLPTWRHAWMEPQAENWQGFAIGGFGSLLTITSISEFNFIALAFPIAITLNSAIVVAVVLSRRRQATPQPS